MSELSKPRIVCAANRHLTTGEVAIGVRHFCPIMCGNIDNFKTLDQLADGMDEYSRGWHASEQGFIDQHGTFYTREDAWKIADANGQIFRDRDWMTGRGGAVSKITESFLYAAFSVTFLFCEFIGRLS